MSGAAVIVGLLGACVCALLWLLYGSLDPAPPPARTSHTAVAPRPTAPATPPTTTPATAPELPPPPEAPPLTGNDTVDPCTASWEAQVPAGYETIMVDGITVAWSPGERVNPGPSDVAFQPTAVAYLIHGLLEEAAALTGTPRRERLTVIVYPSRDRFFAETRAPAWAGGLYDGGAIRLAVKPSAELGVAVSALRHELMHAQLHTAVGCMPSWFNEGLAMYFAGDPPIHQWVRMLRSPDTFDLSSLEAPSLVSLSNDQADRTYAESLAMIVFVLERSGERGLPAAVRTLQTLVRESPRAGLDLWDRLYPGAGHRAVLDSLAHKLFGVKPGSELDAIFQGAVCCYGLRAVTELGCRVVPSRSDKPYWSDQTSAPRALCYATW